MTTKEGNTTSDDVWWAPGPRASRPVHSFLLSFSFFFKKTCIIQNQSLLPPPSLKSTPLQAPRLGHFGRHHRFQLRELLLLEMALVLEPVELRPQPLRHRVLLWYVWDTPHAGFGLLINKPNVIPACMHACTYLVPGDEGVVGRAELRDETGVGLDGRPVPGPGLGCFLCKSTRCVGSSRVTRSISSAEPFPSIVRRKATHRL